MGWCCEVEFKQWSKDIGWHSSNEARIERTENNNANDREGSKHHWYVINCCDHSAVNCNNNMKCVVTCLMLINLWLSDWVVAKEILAKFTKVGKFLDYNVYFP